MRAVEVWSDGGSGVGSSQLSHRSQGCLGQSVLIVLQLGFSLCVCVSLVDCQFSERRHRRHFDVWCFSFTSTFPGTQCDKTLMLRPG